MATIFAKDYNTIKSSPTKDRDDISFEDTKTNGYSIVRSAMLAVIIAIVAVVGVVTFHQSPSLSNGYDSLMSTMAVVHEDDGGDSNIDTIEFDVDTSLGSKDDSDTTLNRCGNLNMSFQSNIPSNLRVSTSGCAFLQNGRVTGQFSVTADGTLRRPPISIRNTNMVMERRATYSLRTGTLVVSVAASPSQRGRVRIRMDWTGRHGSTAFDVRSISGLSSF